MAEAKGGRSGKAHVVVLPYPQQGHINPMMHLCKRLSSLGLFITFVNTEGNHARLLDSRSRAGLASLPEQGFDIDLVCIPGGSPGGAGDAAINSSFLEVDAMQPSFESFLADCIRRRPIDCFICDAFIGWAQDAADKFSIPRVALWASSAAYNVLNWNLPVLTDRGFAPIRDESILKDETQLIDFIPGVHSLHPRDLPSILQTYTPTDPDFKNRTRRTRRLKEAAYVLVNTVEELEHISIAAMKRELPKYLPVGPLLPPSLLGIKGTGLQKSEQGAHTRGGGLWLEDERCLTWLHSQSPSSVVYISFGSLGTLPSSQVKEIAYGIEHSRQPFLWVIRPNSVKPDSDSDSDISGFLDAFVERTKDRGLVVGWAPQLQVLFHPSVGVFFSHFGWNSTLESISMGVPLIGIPLFAEQQLNCKHATENWKVGVKLRRSSETGLVSREEIEQVISRFMTGEGGTMELRIRARELREAAQRAFLEGGSSFRNLRAFVDAVIRRELR